MRFKMDWTRWTLTGRISTRVAKHTRCTFLQGIVCMTGDILLCLVLTVSSYLLLSWHLMEPVHHGFSCDDPTIRHPLYQNTVSTPLLLVLTLGAPFLVVVVGNYLATFGTNLEHLDSMVAVVHASTFMYLDYVLSFWLLTLFLDVVKCAVGRLRPNFVAMCRPDLTACNSSSSHNQEVFERFIVDTTCAANWKKARNSRMSFPSGHAAASFFALAFTIYYFQQLRSQRSKSHGLLRLFQWLSVIFYTLFCAYCCVTRVTDYWHHPSDVAGGVIIAAVAFYLFSRKYKANMKFQ